MLRVCVRGYVRGKGEGSDGWTPDASTVCKGVAFRVEAVVIAPVE